MAEIMDLITSYLKQRHEATWKQIVEYGKSKKADSGMIAEEIVAMMMNGWIKRKINKGTGIFFYQLNKKSTCLR